jgi:nucleoside-diphosphate-sugar epimerase
VITGGAGFIGTHLCRRLLAAGTHVVCVDNFLTSSPVNLGTLRAEPGSVRYEADVAEGLDKRFAEAMTAAYRRVGRADTGIAGIFNTYGPGVRPGDGRVVPTFACQALLGLPLTVAGDGSQTRSLCHVNDTVHGILAVAASGLGGPVNIGNPEEAAVLRIAERIIGLSGSCSGIEHIPLPEDDPLVRCPDITPGRQRAGLAAGDLLARGPAQNPGLVLRPARSRGTRRHPARGQCGRPQ